MSQQPGTHQELREVELKSVVDDSAAARVRLERFGAKLVFEGRLEDRRYDLPDRGLEIRDEALRIRSYRNADGSIARCSMDWKGPATLDRGYKVRSELSIDVSSDETLIEILSRLGYTLSREVDRQIAQYELEHAIIRFEYYPRMDDLVEIEGDPESIERTIAATG